MKSVSSLAKGQKVLGCGVKRHMSRLELCSPELVETSATDRDKKNTPGGGTQAKCSVKCFTLVQQLITKCFSRDEGRSQITGMFTFFTPLQSFPTGTF